MAVDAFLTIGDLQGESIVDGQEDKIQILSWSWGMSQSGTTHTGTGGGAGKVAVADISIQKYMDKSSPGLALACCKGTHYDEAAILIRKAGDVPLDYMSIDMKDVIVTSYSPGGSAGDDRLMDSFTLNFAKFTYTYQPQDNTGGKAGGAIPVDYDIAKNK